MRVRAIEAHESELFSDATDTLTAAWEAGTSRPAWSMVAEDDSGVRARLAFRTAYRNRWGHEVRPFGLNAELSTPEGLEAARLMFRAGMAAAAADGATHIARGVEEEWPEAQEQCDLLRELGIPQVQTKLRFWGEADSLTLSDASTLTGRPFAEHTDEQLVSILADIMDGSLDGVDVANREEMGRLGAAEHLLLAVRDFDHDPAWLTVAYDATGDVVGLYAPVRLDGYGNIGFIGVRPAHRGRGHIHELLGTATRLLLDQGMSGVSADTDSNNAPMAAAFTRAGYESEAPAWYFQARLADLDLG